MLEPHGFFSRAIEVISSIPTVLRYVPLILLQILGRQTLQRTPERRAVTDGLGNVLQYDQVMATKLSIVYAIALEMIYRTRQAPFGGTAIDLACGPGHFSLCVAKYLKLDKQQGIDLSAPIIKVAREAAANQAIANCQFDVGDITDLKQLPNAHFDLCTFTDAAHHMPDLGTVVGIITEMDRITKPDGLVFLGDILRLKSAALTESYVNLICSDYHQRGLEAFYSDFRNSIYAAWTPRELASVISHGGNRKWMHFVPVGLPVIQVILAIPREQSKTFVRRGVPWTPNDGPVPVHLWGHWLSLRLALRVGRIFDHCRLIGT